MKKTVYVLISLLAGVLHIPVLAQTDPGEVATPRMRVIIDNDLNGDPDGLVQLVHHLMSPSVDVRGIIGGHLGKDGWGFIDDDSGTPCAVQAAARAHDVLRILGIEDACPVVVGALSPMETPDEAVDNDGARLIIQEAMRDDTAAPLYVVCGASLTNIASAWLMDPRISERLTLVWIGGQEYGNGAIVPPNYSTPEYNLNLDVAAAQTVFNKSDLRLWQVPRNAYRQCVYSLAEMMADVSPCAGLYTIPTQTWQAARPLGLTDR